MLACPVLGQHGLLFGLQDGHLHAALRHAGLDGLRHGVEQLAAIKESGGLVGLNFATCILRPDGQKGADTPIELMLRHLDHLIAKLGVEHVGLGSDFDGAHVPEAIGDVVGLPVLVAAMRQHGYDETTISRICHANWIDVLERSWRP